MPKKSKKTPRKKATSKPPVIKLTQKQIKQAQESIRKHGVAKFQIQEIKAKSIPTITVSDGTVNIGP